MKEYNIRKFLELLATEKWDIPSLMQDTCTVDDLWDNFFGRYKAIFDSVFPLITKKVRKHKKKYIDKSTEVLNLKKQLDFFFTASLYHPEYLSQYKKLKKLYDNAIKNNKKNYKWKNRWKEISQNNGNKYFLIHKDLPKKVPHIFEFNVNKKYSCIVTRMKINHGLFPAHLFKIGIISSPLCIEDGEIADLNHLIFGCSKTRERNELIEKLLKVGIQLPVNLQALLASEQKDIYDILIEHVIKNDIRI